MMKKLFYIPFVLLSLLGCCFTAQAEDGAEYYEEFDNYEEFEQDYIDNYVVDKTASSNALADVISVPVLLIGAVLGAGAAYLLLHKFYGAPQAEPYFRTPKQTHQTVFEKKV